MEPPIGRCAQVLALCAISLAAAHADVRAADRADAPLAKPVAAVWDLAGAFREATPTRERICINGLWRWQPAGELADRAPDGRWGYFKVPGCWPGITNYMQKDCQTVHAHPSWKDQDLRGIAAAWYQREITVPAAWAGRRINLSAGYVNSCATAYVDGRKAGELWFPGGQVDLTALCRPGGKHVLSVGVVAVPLRGVMLSYADTASARKVKGSVSRRGLCGDVYLVGAPAGPRVTDVKVDTSVRKGEVTCDVALEGLEADGLYGLQAAIVDDGRAVSEFAGKRFRRGDLKGGRIAFAHRWRPGKLWDIHTPRNTHVLCLSLLDAGGKVLDAALPVRFGFREFWIDGRDFYLNGTRIFLSAVPLDNAQVGAAPACYAGARESLLRLKSFGINFVYTHNYGCEPGSHLSFEEVLKAADDVGMLVGLSQPHFAQYDWKMPGADRANGYARHAAFYVRAAQNHPSVVAYATSHNATASGQDMNPDLFGAAEIPRQRWSRNNSRLAMRAEAVIKGLDSSRIVYHHAGDIGSLHASNFYPNFVPIQEMSDWFEHWAAHGVKPAFLCEYGAPFTWDWAMYRGWYRDRREFGSARVPWEFCLAEWNAQFLGDRAFRISDQEKANLRWEAGQFRAGNLWHRWDYPHRLGSRDIAERHPVLAAYITDNWRAFRTWGLSANSPWEHGLLYRLRDGVDKSRRQLPVDWANLQRPGLSADYLEDRYERMDLAFERSDWMPTPSGQAILRNNAPVLAYIAGKGARFTSKDHNFLPGETVEKQIVVINNSRETVVCSCRWSLGLDQPVAGEGEVRVQTGRQARIPLSFHLPEALAPGAYRLDMTAEYGSARPQRDGFTVHVLPRPPEPGLKGKVALFDPQGQTRKLLSAMGLACEVVGAGADLSGHDLLIIGKAALTADGQAPGVARVRDGLRVLVFEQTPEALEQRLGFRVQAYGLRNVFQRVPDHPALAGLDVEHLRDWRGEATLLAPRLAYTPSGKYGGAPTVRWAGLEVPRLWRCGNRGCVASGLIEKPARGDFLPIVDAGFSLQYSPLLEYREGRGMVLFCQMDVTGRSEADPAADRLVRGLLRYASSWQPPARRRALYAGAPAGRAHFESAGVPVGSYEGGRLSGDHVLVVAPGGGRLLERHAPDVARYLKAGGHALMLELDGAEASTFLPAPVRTTKQEHIAAYFEPFGAGSLLAGVGPADVHNRDPRQVPLVLRPATVVGNGVLARMPGLNVVFCQLAPWRISKGRQYNVRRTYRRASFLVTRLLANMGVAGRTPLLSRFAAPAGGPAGQSLLKNGDFRLDANSDGMPDHWQFISSLKQATCTLEKASPPADAPALRIACPAAGEDGAAAVMLAQHDVPTTQGQWYRVSLRARAEALKGQSVSLAVQNTVNWRPLIEYQRFACGTAWREFTFLVRGNATAASRTRFQIWHDGPGTLWLADVAVRAIAPPAEGRWLTGLYPDRPVEWDDPYRFFRW